MLGLTDISVFDICTTQTLPSVQHISERRTEAFFSGFFTGQEGFKISRVVSGRFVTFKISRIGPDQVK